MSQDPDYIMSREETDRYLREYQITFQVEQCQFIPPSGRPCKRPAMPGKNVCPGHKTKVVAPTTIWEDRIFTLSKLGMEKNISADTAMLFDMCRDITASIERGFDHLIVTNAKLKRRRHESSFARSRGMSIPPDPVLEETYRKGLRIIEAIEHPLGKEGKAMELHHSLYGPSFKALCSFPIVRPPEEEERVQYEDSDAVALQEVFKGSRGKRNRDHHQRGPKPPTHQRDNHDNSQNHTELPDEIQDMELDHENT